MNDAHVINFVADNYDYLLRAAEQRYNMDNEDDRNQSIEDHHRLFNSVQSLIDPGCFLELGAGRLDLTAELAESLHGTEFHIVEPCPQQIDRWAKHIRPDMKIHNQPIIGQYRKTARALVTATKNGNKVDLLRTNEQCKNVYSTGSQKVVDMPGIAYNGFLSKNKLWKHTLSLKINSSHILQNVPHNNMTYYFRDLLRGDILQSLYIICDETDPEWSSYWFITKLYEHGFVPLCRNVERPGRSAISFIKDTWKHHPTVKDAMVRHFYQ